MKSLELFKTLGVIKNYPDLEKITKKAYQDLEEKIWRENLESSPHGRPWFTSFHASQFPGGDKPCGRKALYTMLDIPQREPSPAYLRATGEIGKAVEYQIVYRWGKAGLTIGGSVPLWDGGHISQVKFEDASTWLTGSSDAILDLRPDCDFVLPIDIKSKKHDVVQQMQMGQQSYEEKDYLQLQAYLYLCNLFHVDMGWDSLGLKPAQGGFILYASRQDPSVRKEFWIPIDWKVINEGIDKLKQWQENFLQGSLPARPKEWRWTEEPCKWCQFKPQACKPDYKAKTENLMESKAIEFTQSLRKDYNFDEIKEEVLKRWQVI